ncbi:MAG: cation:proton antiporter [Bacteriovorax sp.]|jgi:CPA2 family monovalent cation:H+ antiporter-2
MTHLPDLIKDLAFILITAAFVSILFKKLRQPVVLGYLIAGFFLGPNFHFYFNVKDTASIAVWAELGVIFLLFGLGLEFSFKKLSRIGKSAGITAIFETSMMFILGYGAGQFFGWRMVDCLFLGGMIAISSTTIIVKAFEELGLKGKDFVHLVFGVLVVEDLIAILFLVILTTFGVGNSFSIQVLFNSIFRLAFFLTIWFLVGIYVIPLLLKKIQNQLSDETMIVVSLGLCLFMVVIATSVGFSAPLGAFIMGSILAETREGKKIENLIAPIQKLFSPIFFVSVGMMISMQSLVTYANEILAISVLIMFGKIFSVFMGALLSGQNIKTSVHAGFSLAQIGEFSFIIAALGLSMKVTSDFLYPIAVAVSAITTFATPYLIRVSYFFNLQIEQKIPPNFRAVLDRYQIAMSAKGEKGAISLLWDAYGVRIVLNVTLVVAISLFFKHIISPYLLRYFVDDWILRFFSSVAALFVAAPFFWAIFFGSPDKKITEEISSVVKLSNLLLGITVFRIVIGTVLVVFLIGQFTEIYNAIFATLAIIIIAIFFFKNIVEIFYKKIENRFIKHLNEKEREEVEKKKIRPNLAPWDAVLSEYVVSPTSSICGKTLLNSMLKERFNITIALIERGESRIIAPSRDVQLMPYDRLHLIGTETQLALAKEVIEEARSDHKNNEADIYYKLESILLSEKSGYINKSIRECGLREKIDGIIVGIERDGKRILSPDSQLVLRTQDLLWVVGDVRKINKEGKII